MNSEYVVGMPNGAGGRETEDLGIEGLENAEFVGRGGSAVVYRAKQSSLQRTVAVKLLTSSWDDSVARRFDREQRAMGRLSNRPGIVPIYESGLTSNGVPYIMMPFYADGSLKDWSDEQGPIAWQQATEIILDVAEAVGRAHNEGIVHRDLKPANVLLSGTGRPLLADFGLARLASDETGVATTAVTFTPAYCPPEVLDEADPVPTADTYALAATFWALVKGRPPFTDSDTVLAMEAVLKRVLTENVAPLEEVPAPIAAFVERSMSKDPGDRPTDGQAFADQLREAVAASTSTVRPLDNDQTVWVALPSEGREDRPSPVAQRENKRRLVVAVLTVLLVAGVTAAAILRPRSDEVATTSETVEPVTVPDVVAIQPEQPIQLLTLSADPLASESVQARRAADLAIASYGSIEGFDMQLLPTLEIACEEQLAGVVRSEIEMTEAAVVIGSTCSVSASALMDIASQRGISWISSDLRAPNLTAGFDGSEGDDHTDGFFRTAQNDHFQGAVAAQFALDELEADTAVIVSGGGAGEQEIAQSFASVFEQTGEVTVLQLDEESGVAGVAAATLAAQPDVTFWILDPATAVELASELDQLSLAPPERIVVETVLSPAAVVAPAMLDAYVVMALQPAEESMGALGQTLEELTAAYVREFGEAPADNLAFASAYDATILALASIDATAAVVGDTLIIDRLALRSHLETARSDGLTGSLVCNFFGDCGSQALAVVQIDGESIATTTANVVKFFGRASS